MSKPPIPLAAPDQGTMDLRVQVVFKEPLATELRRLAVAYQCEPAVLVRQLVVDGLRAREPKAS